MTSAEMFIMSGKSCRRGQEEEMGRSAAVQALGRNCRLIPCRMHRLKHTARRWSVILLCGARGVSHEAVWPLRGLAFKSDVRFWTT